MPWATGRARVAGLRSGLATANQRPVTAACPYYIGTSAHFFDPGYRAATIDAALTPGSPPQLAGGRIRAAVFCRSLSMPITARRTASAAMSCAGSTPSENSRLSSYITPTTACA